MTMIDCWRTCLESSLVLVLLLLMPFSTAYSPTSLPTLRCPVGKDLRSMYFFHLNDASGKVTDSTKINEITGRHVSWMDQDNSVDDKKSEVITELGITGPTSLSDDDKEEDLINLASLYYGLKMKGAVNSVNHLQLRTQAEDKVTQELESDGSKKYFTWHKGLFSDQELVMMMCSADYRFPTAAGNSFVHIHSIIN